MSAAAVAVMSTSTMKYRWCSKKTTNACNFEMSWQRRFSPTSSYGSLKSTCKHQSGFVLARECSIGIFLRKKILNGSLTTGRSERDGVDPSPSPSSSKKVEVVEVERRQLIFLSLGLTAASATSLDVPALAATPRSEFADMPALRGKDYGKTRMRYPDYTLTESGLQYKDLRVGTGPTPKTGETVVVDWDGYTIGYYGRIFEARNKTKGGSFEGDDKDFFKFKIGSQQVIPAFEEAVSGMPLGGIRRIIVPPDLGYPGNDFNKKGPRPTTFSGQRALDFVLRNQGLIDKTLLFDIELLKIIPN